MDILQINCKDLISASEDEVLFDIVTLNKFNKYYVDNYKIIGINFPTNTKTQQSYYNHKINREQNPYLREIQIEKLNELVNIEKNNTDREYYIMIFGKDYVSLSNNKSTLINNLKAAKLIKEMPFFKKVQILFKLTNKNTTIYSGEKFFNYQRNFDTDEQVKMLGYNPYLLNIIQPQGGISFKADDCIRTGDGYENCIRVYEFPQKVDRHWLTYIMNIPLAVTTVDVRTLNSVEVKKNLNKSIAEYKSRLVNSKTFAEENEAYNRMTELGKIFQEVSSMGEVIKEICCRIYVSAKTKKELDDRVAKIIKYLEGNEYKATILLNEGKYEYEALYYSIDEQDNEINKRKAFPVTTSTLSGGNPFHFTNLNDKYGSLYGTTTTKGMAGKVIWDAFASDEKRTSYNGVVFGRMGSGKSTFLKKMMRDRAGRGDYVRVIDVNGEFEDTTVNLGGKIITLDGSNGIINPLQIFKLAETESNSFSMHLSKLNTMYKFIAPESSHAERLEFECTLRNLYIEKGIIPTDITDLDNSKFTNLNNEKYPILSDLLDYVLNELIPKEKREDSKKYLTNIARVIKDLVENYGKIFNGHTSIEELVEEQVVCFNIKDLSSLKSEIFDAQLFNALSLCWSNAVKIGTKMKYLVETGRIKKEYAKHFLLLLDESHKTINSTKPYAVEQVLVYSREGRKFFAGIYLASQSIRDFVPEGTNAENFDKIKTLFELSQYKFIMNQDTEAVDMMTKIFKGQLTESEIQKIPRLERGQTILSISGDTNITFSVEVTKEELDMFKGGI